MDGRPSTLAVFTQWTEERYGDATALRFRTPDRDGRQTRTYAELGAAVRAAGRALLGLGVGAGERVAVLAETRPEWTYTHFGILAAGAVLVPVYPTAGEEELAWVLSDSEAVVAVCEDAAQAARVEALRPKLPALRAVVRMDVTGPPPEPSDAELAARAAAVTPAADAAIVYTSGTTGLPKGCRLTHGNLGAVQDATLPLVQGGPGDSTYLYLPLAHLLAQLIQFTTLLEGGELCYFGGRIEDVVAEIAEARPTHLPSVPRLFEKLHAVVLGLAEGRDGGRERFEEAVRLGVLAADGALPAELRPAWEAAEDSLYALVRAAFGGRLRWALTGGAPIAPATLDFLRACGIRVFEGYGMTESAGVISLNHPGAVRYGTVGRPVAGCEVRIAPDGEVLARGPMVFPGYHANPDATAGALDPDGWLRTGDLGELDADGFLSITGRKKELIITSAGKNITPTEVEFAVQAASPLVSRAVLIGDRRPHPVALITLDAGEVAAWAARESLDLGPAPAAHPALRERVAQAVAAANATVSRPARIRAFRVLDEELSVGAGTLTPTLKLRRAEVARRYAAEIEELYAS
ncbi:MULTISPECIES: AMP-dependent synthetase/ligase [Streptomyces]|uniref:AMP-dependent synthetase/ligase n=1 Tax=Streptomyces TaxID=1883 RepID=UPI000F773FDA|nr:MULTISPECIES: AMP-dependent synthetase/ligase [Streptomyces]RST01684.1 long-chain fatty acid--CoA ligase [Streptomyces sp. WAC07149]GLX21086.1 long-chain acyl-CoA synthetase [Streptomyces lavendulae subsp. lavendulae]GLX25630.1 long-chain acyl-CoA synthetase [Streptomyces lavendulae subsp. lavendulae]